MERCGHWLGRETLILRGSLASFKLDTLIDAARAQSHAVESKPIPRGCSSLATGNFCRALGVQLDEFRGCPMPRSSVLALSLLVFSSPALGQATPAESPTLQAMLAEIRQLRQDLQTSAIAARRAQILVYRLHVQEAAVAHASQRLDEAKSSAEQLRARRKYQEIQIKQYETLKGRAENAAQGQQFEDAILDLKAQTEALAGEEQDAQMRETELEQQSRIEQAKLDQLQDELDRLDRAVMNAALHAASTRQ